MIRERWNDSWNLIWTRTISRGTTSNQLSTLSSLLDPIILTEARDEWIWLLDPNFGFTVKKTRIHLDDALLPDAYISTRWCRFISKKVNIFVWRALRDRLPTRWNLNSKGVELESILCPNCLSSPENLHHSLWTCIHATCVWLKVFNWLELPCPTPSSIQDVYEYVDQLHFQKERKSIIEAIFGVVLWTLWNFRNQLIFSSHCMARNEIFDKITSTSFLWCRVPWLEPSMKTQLDGTRSTPQVAFSSTEPSPPAEMVPENAT
ncbi:reverse transcriptase domain, Reverse transcriptase zinc-binding domain protein [Artemisia annua]|uniref:Reverse transcriptase domain, Reverse transcriptase zinc-binding domain protein n=1 Tax=Artemisia annua TaxID=35608 RepID=A0A2U1NL31_ARTAN|nr:reverse transcriptase domain, Reverse transcriptase zinc-binding domain protein [Artemisia annua]